MNLSQRKSHFLSAIFVICLSAIWCSQTVVSIKAQTPAEEMLLLEPGKTLERELAGGQRHKFKIEAKANEFLQVKVEQKGVDVVVKLFNKDSRQLAEMNTPSGNQGIEALSFIIADAGVYTIEISVLETNTAKGSYAIFRESPRTATEKDRLGIEANNLFAEGSILASQGTAQSLQAALPKLEKALQLYKAGGFKNDEAFNLYFLGNIHYSLNQKPKAIEHFLSSLDLMREIGDKQGEMLALNSLALTLSDLGENQKALKYFDEILPVFRQFGDKRSEASALNNIGGIYENLGEMKKALEFYLKALPIFKEIQDQGNLATTLNNIGLIYAKTGENKKALENYNQALNIFKTIGDAGGVILTLNNIAQVYSKTGEKQKALDQFAQVLILLEKTGNKNSEAITRNNIGTIYSSLGEKQKALEYFNQAVLIFNALGLTQPEATLLSNIGGVYNDLNEWEKSANSYEKSLQLIRAIGDKRSEGKILNNIGRAYTELRNKQKSLEFYNEALKLSKIYYDRELQARTLYNLGILSSFLLNDNQKALEYYTQALPLHRAIEDTIGEANTLANIMYAWDLLGNRHLAILYGKQSINLSQSLRANIQNLDKEIQRSFLGTVEEHFRKLAELLITEERIPEAERVLRMLKEEEYFEFAGRDGSLVSTLDERINLALREKQAAEQYEKILLEIGQIGKELEELEKQKSNASAEQVKSVTDKQAELNKGLEVSSLKLKTFLDDLSKTFAKKEVDTKNVEESSQAIVKEWKDPRTAVISTIVGLNNLSLIVTTAEFQRGYVVPISEGKLNGLARDFRTKVSSGVSSDPKPAAQELYNVLIKPIEKDLEAAKAKTLIWSLDKFLRYAPIPALWDKDKGYLVQNYSNVILALASRENLALRPVDKKDWKVFGVGVSKQIGDFPSLSYAKDELQAIVRDTSVKPIENEFGIIEGQRLLNEQFTKDSFRKNLNRFTHASTHFKFIQGDKDKGLESFLLLGSGDGLTLAEIQKEDNYFKGVELLTLSACDTAYGEKTSDGREIEGFGVLAQRKGARAILATLWRVDQSSTMNLMVNFYDFYQKDEITKAEALRQAQLSLLQAPDKFNSDGVKPKMKPDKDFSHPYHWSGFVLIGNWW